MSSSPNTSMADSTQFSPQCSGSATGKRETPMISGITTLPLERAKYFWGLRQGSSLPIALVSNACPRTRLQSHYCSWPSARCRTSTPATYRPPRPVTRHPRQRQHREVKQPNKGTLIWLPFTPQKAKLASQGTASGAIFPQVFECPVRASGVECCISFRDRAAWQHMLSQAQLLLIHRME